MEPSKRMKKRIMFFLCFLTAVLLLLIVRVGYLQIFQGPELKKEALEQQTKDSIITPKRGTIYDRNGNVLAVSASVETVYVHPAQIKEDKGEKIVAQELSQALEMDYNDVYKLITKKVSYVDVKKKVEKGAAQKVRELKTNKETKDYFRGVGLSEDSKRYYPLNTLASSVIGFVGSDNQGLAGVEASYDSYLRGTPGRVSSLKDAKGTTMNEQHEEQTASKDGSNLILTLDESMQHFLENHLKTAYTDNKLGNGACGIVMNVKTGEVLAMATEGDFNLNEPFTITDEATNNNLKTLSAADQTKAKGEALQKMWRNKAVSDTYEPGSTFKIVVAAAALEEKTVSLEDKFTCAGSLRVGGYNIRCWKAGGHGAETFLQGIQNSCNVVFMQVGMKLGPDRFIKYYNAFGFNQKTGIDLPGEAVGLFHARSNFKETEIATASFGQGFQITPLQLITAVSAVANGGNLMKPHVVSEIRDSNNKVTKKIEPEVVRQVISTETSKAMRSVLESVVSEGSASRAYIPGYRVAGKTGTSEKQPRSAQKKIASFIAFAPANDPQVACLIMLDEPNGGQYFGGIIAAPVVHDIMKDTLDYLQINKQYTAEEMKKYNQKMPDVKGKTVAEAQSVLKDYSFKVKIDGNGKTVVSQMPAPEATLSENSTVVLYTTEKAIEKSVELPDLSGKTYQQAKETLQRLGLNISSSASADVSDSDIVTGQSPTAGTMVYPATSVELKTTNPESY